MIHTKNVADLYSSYRQFFLASKHFFRFFVLSRIQFLKSKNNCLKTLAASSTVSYDDEFSKNLWEQKTNYTKCDACNESLSTILYYKHTRSHNRLLKSENSSRCGTCNKVYIRKTSYFWNKNQPLSYLVKTKWIEKPCYDTKPIRNTKSSFFQKRNSDNERKFFCYLAKIVN